MQSKKTARVFHFRAQPELYQAIEDTAGVLNLRPSTFARMAVAEKVAQIRAMQTLITPAQPAPAPTPAPAQKPGRVATQREAVRP